MRLYTQNVRLDTPNRGAHERPWAERKHALVNSILFHTAGDPSAIVGTQEVLQRQLEDLRALLGEEWAFVGVGRDDGKQAGEYSAVFYRKSYYDVRAATFWLSPTPHKPSRGWDAALNRIVTQARFTAKKSGTDFHVYCTHFDHAGPEARAESAKLILRLMGDQSGPQFLLGDLNSQPHEPPHQTLAAALHDAADAPLRYGHTHTYTGFDPNDVHTRIDYIFYTGGPRALRYGVLHAEFGSRFSDHRPVVADFDFAP